MYALDKRNVHPGFMLHRFFILYGIIIIIIVNEPIEHNAKKYIAFHQEPTVETINVKIRVYCL